MLCQGNGQLYFSMYVEECVFYELNSLFYYYISSGSGKAWEESHKTLAWYLIQVVERTIT
jgi:hypothetical protein